MNGAARAAWAVVNQNRWRSSLTLTICALGTAGVIVAGAIGNAQVAEMQKRLAAVGGRLISSRRIPFRRIRDGRVSSSTSFRWSLRTAPR